MPRLFKVVSLAVFLAAISNSIPTHAGLFDDISGLSMDAQSSLVVHFDGRRGVNTTGSAVDSWDGYDGTGNNVVSTLVSMARSGGGDPSLISYNGSDTVVFDDTTVSAEGRRLEGPLTTSGADLSYTIFWKGHYDSDNRNGFQNSGLYSYNIDGEMSHQRDDGGGGFVLELYDGSTTHVADDITAYDDTDSVWTTIYTTTSHSASVNGVNLNPQGNPSYNVADDPTMIMGAFSASGFDFLGQIKEMIIFETALDSADVQLVESYLLVPEPSTSILLLISSFVAVASVRRRQLM